MPADPAGVPIASETGEADTGTQDSRATGALSGAAENSYKEIPGQALSDPPTSERRQCPRQCVSFSFIDLGDDNGGIILDVSERGLAMQTVGSLTDDQAPHIRFLLPQPHAWVETRARIAWVSASKKTAGVEFIGLPDEARNQIKQWISLELQLNEPVKDNPATYEPENVIPFPEPETTGRIPENPNLHSISGGAVEVPPSVEKVLPYSWVRIDSRKTTDFSSGSGRLIGFTVGTVLLLSALFLWPIIFKKHVLIRRSKPYPPRRCLSPRPIRLQVLQTHLSIRLLHRAVPPSCFK